MVQNYQIAYYIKRNPAESITMGNINDMMIAGVLDGDPLD